ncbi:hypothetical protein HUU53_04050 [Candidatus Micrarchaeota archaeon]|nr:hypothetical protein [Candidatus Micrarchaeota archaeon]
MPNYPDTLEHLTNIGIQTKRRKVELILNVSVAKFSKYLLHGDGKIRGHFGIKLRLKPDTPPTQIETIKKEIYDKVATNLLRGKITKTTTGAISGTLGLKQQLTINHTLENETTDPHIFVTLDEELDTKHPFIREALTQNEQADFHKRTRKVMRKIEVESKK